MGGLQGRCQRSTSPVRSPSRIVYVESAFDGPVSQGVEGAGAGVIERIPTSAGRATENYLFALVGHGENNNGVVQPDRKSVRKGSQVCITRLTHFLM